MRLEELRKPPELELIKAAFADDSHYNKKFAKEELINIMEEGGWKFMGSGNFGLTFSHPNYPDSILKIFYDDPQVMDWVKNCINNRSNPYFPRYKSMPVKISQNLYALRMEKLSFKTKKIQNLIEDCMFILFQDWTVTIINNNFEMLNNALLSGRMGDSLTADQLAFFKKYIPDTDFQQAVRIIYKLSSDHGYMLDAHGENVMFRDDQLVFVDPLAS